MRWTVRRIGWSHARGSSSFRGRPGSPRDPAARHARPCGGAWRGWVSKHGDLVPEEGDIVKLRGLVCAAVVVATAVVGVGISASPADAATACYNNYQRLQVPTDHVDVWVNLCVISSGGNVQAEARVRWDRPAAHDSIRDFDYFTVNVRLERADAVIRSNNCVITELVNEHETSYVCETSWAPKGSAQTWTSDGAVVYDINLDGQGRFSWDLRGSPAI